MKQNRFPISHQLNIGYNAFEDRLVLRASRAEETPAAVFLTRRMTLLILKQLLDRLTAMSDLDKTPREYWHDVMQMGHEQAMQAKQDQDKAQQAQTKNADEAADDSEQSHLAESTSGNALYLATEITVKRNGKEVMLALKGLPMPVAMTRPTKQEPILAIPLQQENIHQIIEIFITRTTEAGWDIPVQIPWRNRSKRAAGSKDSARLDN